MCLYCGVVAVSQVESGYIRAVGSEEYTLYILAISTAYSLKLNLASLLVVDVILSGREKECCTRILAAVGSGLAESIKVVLTIIRDCTEFFY